MITTIDSLFNIKYGQREYHNKEWLGGEEGNKILVSSKGLDNGVYGFYNITDKFIAPVITVQGYGTIGHAFVQEYDCSVDDHLLVLIPKVEITREELYQVAFQIRLTKWKYKYGRGITPDRLRTERVSLSRSKVNWDDFEARITPSPIKNEKSLSLKERKIFRVYDLFDIARGEGAYLEELGGGSTPVISPTASDNGACGFYDIEPTFKAPAITIGRIMCNPNVQLVDFATVPDDMFVLIPKMEMPNEFLFYISSLIKAEGWKFNYARKVTRDKLGKLDLHIPMQSGSIDMDNIINAASSRYGYKELGMSSYQPTEVSAIAAI
jgi:hypothetical protein